MSSRTPLNYYGGPVIDPALFDGPHVVNPMGPGKPPCCSCGWTPWGAFTMADHLNDMGPFVKGVAAMLENRGRL